jgi:NAD(P)H-dependent FMN reductase
MKIAIVSSSIRIGRKSHRMALFFKNYITENKIASVDLIDLNEYSFPIFEERLSNMKNPPPDVLQFAERII